MRKEHPCCDIVWTSHNSYMHVDRTLLYTRHSGWTKQYINGDGNIQQIQQFHPHRWCKLLVCSPRMH